jgi:type II secretory pathway component PulM
MMPAWYERMNPRERLLAWIVAGAMFVLLNLVILSWLLGALGRARTDLTALKAARAEQDF